LLLLLSKNTRQSIITIIISYIVFV